jgi:hydroxyacylglutathione hydrolase
MAVERAINPFLRCAEHGVIEVARSHGAADDSGPEVFGALRRWKDSFR